MGQTMSLVDELSDLLSISKDSAYRRIRGETSLTFSEIAKLSKHFEISVDKLFQIQGNTISFDYRSLEILSFEDYLKSLLDNLNTINQHPERKLIYAAKDVPIFHYFQFQSLTAFKFFFWRKSILEYPEYQNKIFDFDLVPKGLLETGLKIWNGYLNLPSIEIWSNETINATLRQMEFYWEGGVLNGPDALVLCDQMDTLIHHIKREAELGKKIFHNRDDSGSDKTFELYYNEVAIADNTILFLMGDSRITFIPHNMLNTLSTTHNDFGLHTEHYVRNMIKKSTLISSTAEKERNKFFKKMLGKVQVLRTKIEQE